MEPVFNFFLQYPYLYQLKEQLFTLATILILGFFACFIYFLITFYMTARVKRGFDHYLKIAGILIVVFFFAELTVSLITSHQVNKQLGFSYATPDTPEGELFEIQKVVPGKTMDRAGLKSFDQVQMRDVDELYKLLINNQGKEVVIPVKRDKEEIKIRVLVPELEVPLEGISFLF